MLPSMRRAGIVAVTALPLAFMLAGAVSAQTPMARSGEFSLTYTFVNPEVALPNIPRGVDADIYYREWMGWMTNNDPNGTFMDGMSGRCIATFRREGTTVVEIHGNCVFTDAQGDQVWEQYDRYPGDTTPLMGHWVGGTGKYAGLTGEFTIAGFANVPIEDHLATAGTKAGTYTLPPL